MALSYLPLPRLHYIAGTGSHLDSVKERSIGCRQGLQGIWPVDGMGLFRTCKGLQISRLALRLAPHEPKGSKHSYVDLRPDRDSTRDLLLRRHFRSVAGWCRMWPDVPVHDSGDGWMRLGVAQCLSSLAPR